MKKLVIGILAHVDAGKTTLAESLLFTTGALRTQGRVDDKNTVMDTHTLEKERGITIFSSMAHITTGDTLITLLDTPGHVDFSAETERTLSVLDYAILVISGIQPVQPHTLTLFRLLKLYNIPTFIFVTKMDFSRIARDEIMQELCRELDENCIDIEAEGIMSEHIAMCSEDALDKFISGEEITDADVASMVAKRELFPVFFGSGLKNTGIDEFLDGIDRFTQERTYPDCFGARVFKITHEKDLRLTFVKITGGKLDVKDLINIGESTEKVNRIRIINGSKYESVNSASAGDICALEGIESAENGDGLGFEENGMKAFLEPVMNFRVVLPENVSADEFLPKLRVLEEEEPLLRVMWDSFRKEIHIGLMGQVQAEIFRSIVASRFGVNVEIDNGMVQYLETIEDTVEGVGHYEPLRHYSEVHLILEPLPQGSGLEFRSTCSEDILDRNWQRLILCHLAEKQHIGVLTGSPITDMRITLAGGRAHLKHTEGGDFRQSTYRAVRQGLMKAKSILLEPVYYFTLEIPSEQLGRAISDIRAMSGEFDNPDGDGVTAIITGKAPVTEINDYASVVAAYSGGRGRLVLENGGYMPCHNTDAVIEKLAYNPEADLENTPDSVFCAHGAGFPVKWNEVENYMHLESCLRIVPPDVPRVNHRNFHIDDKELQAIMEREFGKVKYELYRPSVQKPVLKDDFEADKERKRWVIVDGYNVIFAWEDLKKLAETDLGGARDMLAEILCNYSAYTGVQVVLVFDAYRVPGSGGEKINYKNISIVYTKERELADVYIEKMVSEIGKNERVTVVSSDNLIQLSAVRFGVLRCSAPEFERAVDDVHARISTVLEDMRKKNKAPSISMPEGT